jgi:hypothetical protein
LALWVVRGCPQHGLQAEHCQVARVFWFVKNNVEYRQDPADYDAYLTACRTLESGGADCDDHTTLVCAMLSAIGFKTGAKVVSRQCQLAHLRGRRREHLRKPHRDHSV